MGIKLNSLVLNDEIKMVFEVKFLRGHNGPQTYLETLYRIYKEKSV